MVLAISLLTALYLVIKEMRLQSLDSINVGPQINKFKCVFISFTIAYGLRALWQIGLGHYSIVVKSEYIRQIIQMFFLLAWDVPSVVVVLFFHLAIARQNAKDD